MPTYANQITNGTGKYRARLVFEGWPEYFVSDPSLLVDLNDGRTAVLGLDPQTLRVAASVDLARAELTEQEQVVEIVDDNSATVTASLSKKPTVITNLTHDATKTDTSLTLASTAGMSNGDYIYIGSETILIGTVASTTSLTGCTRGRWGTTGQAHFTSDGARLRYPRVTNRPRSLRGRRVQLYLYGLADAASGGGTERWRGIARTDAAFLEGRYSFSIEPLSWLFQQQIGGDLEEPVSARGIHLPESACCAFYVARHTGTTPSSAWDSTDQAFLTLSGFWETQELFIVALNAKLATLISGFTWDADSVLTAETDGPGGWRLVYRPGTTTAYYVTIGLSNTSNETGALQGASFVDIVSPESAGSPPRWISPTTGTALDTLTTNGTALYIGFSAAVPRGVFGYPDLEFGPGVAVDAFFDRAGDGTYRATDVYLGGNVVPTTSMLASIGAHGEEPVFSPATAVTAATRKMRLEASRAVLIGPTTMITLARVLVLADTLVGLMAQIVADSPGTVNTGAMPLITYSDIDSTFGELGAAERSLRAANRTWITAAGVSFAEILKHEHRLRGAYMAPGSDGKLTWKRLRAPLPTDVEVFDLQASTIGPGLPAVARNVDGHLKEVLFRQGWNPLEGEHLGLTIRVRDVSGIDSSPLGGVLEIAPRSFATLRGTYGLEIDPLDAELLGDVVLGMFSGGYRIITVPVTLVHFAANIGEVGILTTPLLPDSDGTMGITNKEALLIGYDWSPFEGAGSMTLLLSDLNIGGYSPSMKVASQVNDTGDQWTITVTLTGYTTATTTSTWFVAGDEVRVVEYNAASPTIAVGVVDATPGAATVQVTFDGTWTPAGGTGLWWLCYDTSANIDETAPSGRRWAQSDFAKIGGTDGQVALGSGDALASDLAP